MTCTSYAPGHLVHFIQIKLAHQKPGELKKVCVLGHDGHWLTFEMDGALHRVWNHDPEVIRAFHDEAVALQSNPDVATAPLYFTSVKLLSVCHRREVRLYADPEGPSECTHHPGGEDR